MLLPGGARQRDGRSLFLTIHSPLNHYPLSIVNTIRTLALNWFARLILKLITALATTVGLAGDESFISHGVAFGTALFTFVLEIILSRLSHTRAADLIGKFVPPEIARPAPAAPVPRAFPGDRNLWMFALLCLASLSATLTSCENLTPEERAMLLRTGERVVDRGLNKWLPEKADQPVNATGK
jgi:hypothetical protein